MITEDRSPPPQYSITGEVQVKLIRVTVSVHTDIDILVVPMKVHQIDDKFMFQLLQNSDLRHQIVSTFARELALVDNLTF